MVTKSFCIMTTLTQTTKEQYIAEGNKYDTFRNLPEERKEQFVEHFMQAEYLDLRCDWAFKRVLSDKDLLLLLLNDFLPEEISEVTSVNTEPKRLGGTEKTVLMDIVARASDGREIVIEMQRFEKTNFLPRMFYYGASMVRSQLGRGKDYSKLKPVYVICFMDFMLKHLRNQLVYKYQMMELESKELYGKWLSIYLCELPRLQKTAMSEMNYVEGWFHIFRESSNFAGKPEGMDAHFDRVIDAAQTRDLPESAKLDYFNAMVSDKERIEYGNDRYKAGMEKGIEKGIEKGMEMKNLELAAKFKSLDTPLEIITKATGLSIEQIKAL